MCLKNARNPDRGYPTNATTRTQIQKDVTSHAKSILNPTVIVSVFVKHYSIHLLGRKPRIVKY